MSGPSLVLFETAAAYTTGSSHGADKVILVKVQYTRAVCLQTQQGAVAQLLSMRLADNDFACTYYASFHVQKDATVELEGTECATAPFSHATCGTCNFVQMLCTCGGCA